MFISFDDIVFKGRNQDYGAFRIRATYNRLVIWAFAISTFIFALVLAAVMYMYFIDDEPAISAGDIIATYEMMTNDDINLPTPPGDDMKKQEETITPKPELNVAPKVVSSHQQTIPEKEKEKVEIKDTTAKLGDKLTLKGEGSGGDTNVYFRVEKLPEFPGGRQGLDKYLRDNIRYPASAVQKKIKGTVHVCFKVSKTGRVYDVKVTKSVDPDIDKEAIRVVKGMPVWSPGKRHGEPVNVIQVLPIKFFMAV
jgi:protein TonB